MKVRKRHYFSIAGTLILLGLLLVSNLAYAHMEERTTTIKVVVDGVPVEGQTFFHTELLRVFAPVDTIAKALGGKAEYDSANKTVTIKAGGNEFKSVVGEKTVVINGQVAPVESGARLVKGNPVVPVRFLVEALGGGVKWNAASRTVEVLAPLKVELLPPGHWHVYKEKKLSFRVTNIANGAPVKGLKLVARLTGLNGWTRVNSVAGDTVIDNGDGTYTSAFIPMEAGSDYIHPYVITVSFQYAGQNLSNFWPLGTTRDGPEDIIKEGTNGESHAYQVRYSWQAGDIYADDGKAVTMFFEPMKSVEEGDQINRQQPFRNTFNHLSNLNATVVVKSVDGMVSEEIPATYKGKGIYTASRVFTKAEAETGRDYIINFVFADPDTGAVIGPEDNQLPLKVLSLVPAPAEDVSEPSQEDSSGTMRLADGKRLYESNCASCHALPDEAKIRGYKTDSELKQLVNNMGQMSGLAQDDIDKIFEYLNSTR